MLFEVPGTLEGTTALLANHLRKHTARRVKIEVNYVGNSLWTIFRILRCNLFEIMTF
jgi:hypothetical protein